MRHARSIVFFVITTVVLGVFTLYVSNALATNLVEYENSTVVVRDLLGPRVHRLSGMVMVPTACHDLLATTREIDHENYLLEFETWEDPNRVCGKDSAPRQFSLTLFAPAAGVSFQGMLDGAVVPLEVIPVVE